MKGQMPPLNWLATFRTVIDTGSFVKAARQLNVTPSAVSHQMRGLESRLGVTLFQRANRAIHPTEAALSYHEALRESFARIIAATSRLAAGQESRRLAIHSAPSFATLLLMPRLKSFIRAHAAIDVTLSSSNEPVRIGREGFDIDIQHARPVPEHCNGLLLAEELVVPLAAPGFLAEHPIASAADITSAPVIHSMRCTAQWESWFARHGGDLAAPRRGMRFDRSFLALAAAADGFGIALESTLLAQDFIRAGRLVMPLGPVGVMVRAHRLVYAHGAEGDETIIAFQNWMRTELGLALIAER